MKKIIVLLVLIITFGFIIKIPEYHELNDLAIIQGVSVEYKNNSYIVYMKEVIPIRSDMGIDYKFKYYEGESSDLEKAIERVQDRTKKRLYYKKVKFLATNIENSDYIKDILKINPKNVYHPAGDIKEHLKKTNS